ncbi:hypothetical protein QUW14_16540 [Bacteroides gallinaceum]|uniref:hypothetical protein n=1 Tax=Bacteroides gallinaceum TaxID=1462571 RepID=UPI0025A38A9E|nr:hypothetical protein [Bacteroides gallinaceum]MDM8155881.1 hypothetical protein [Bacteroides gallinaceum]
MKKEYASLCQFILFVLLQEGKSNLPYRICLFTRGKRHTALHYFHVLFENCDANTFHHYCSLYEKTTHKPMVLPDGYRIAYTNDGNRLTGKLIKPEQTPL